MLIDSSVLGFVLWFYFAVYLLHATILLLHELSPSGQVSLFSMYEFD